MKDVHFRVDQGMWFWHDSAGEPCSHADILTVAERTGIPARELNEMAYQAGDRSEAERDRIAALLP